jgi:hypothetical protein
MRSRNQPNQCRLQVEELERRETPSSMVGTSLLTAGHHHHTAGQLAGAEQPIPSAIGSYTLTLSLAGSTNPIVVPVTINDQTGASFSTTFDVGGTQVNLKEELNPAKHLFQFQLTLFSNGQKVGMGSGEGSFVANSADGGQIQSFTASFTFQMTNGTTGSGTATLVRN